jgi:hypothetical protein
MTYLAAQHQIYCLHGSAQAGFEIAKNISRVRLSPDVMRRKVGWHSAANCETDKRI